MQMRCEHDQFRQVEPGTFSVVSSLLGNKLVDLTAWRALFATSRGLTLYCLPGNFFPLSGPGQVQHGLWLKLFLSRCWPRLPWSQSPQCGPAVSALHAPQHSEPCGIPCAPVWCAAPWEALTVPSSHWWIRGRHGAREQFRSGWQTEIRGHPCACMQHKQSCQQLRQQQRS